MDSRKLVVGACLLSCVAFAGVARGAERTSATLRIEVRVRDAVRPPHPPRKHGDAEITFSFEDQSKLTKMENEERLNDSARAEKSDKSRESVLRTTTYTIE